MPAAVNVGAVDGPARARSRQASSRDNRIKGPQLPLAMRGGPSPGLTEPVRRAARARPR